MYKPYIKPVSIVLPDYKIADPRISKLVLLVTRIFGRLYLFFGFGIIKIILRNGHPFFDAYQRALAGKSRCIIAFRHPNGEEAQVLMWFVLFMLRSRAKKAGFTFCRRPYVSFVYGYEVVRWGGALARWIMPGTGAMPVYHTKIDSMGMNRIIKAMTEGPYPLALAPEGQVSYMAESVPRLEQGTVRLAFNAAEILEKQGKDIPIEILPVSIHFRYGKMGHRSLDKLIRKIEKYTGFKKDGTDFAGRLGRARDFILEQNEKRYGIALDREQTFAGRVDAIMAAALAKAEKILGVSAKSDDLINRMYFIRQTCWDRMVIPGLYNLDHLTLLERAMMDLKAGEAWYARCHMELVDFVWYFRGPIPKEDAPLHTKMEYAQNLWDFANRTMGGALQNRVPNVHPKQILIQAAPVINVSKRLKEYKENRKETIATVTNDLLTAYLECIDRAAEYQIQEKK